MDRMQADGLVRRAERQGNAFLQSILVGYVLGFVAMLALLGAKGQLSRWPASVGELFDLLWVLLGVPIIFFGMVFAIVFKIRFRRTPEWKFGHAISIESDVDMKTFDLLDAIEETAAGRGSEADAALVQDVLRGELAKAQQAGAEPICIAAYLRMRLEDHRHDSERLLSDDDCRPMLELIDERDPG